MKLPTAWQSACVIACMAVLGGCATPTTRGPVLHVVNSVLTTGHNYKMDKRIPVHSFSTEDVVMWLVEFAWDEVGAGGGTHKVAWVWSKDGNVVSKSESTSTFKYNPNETWTRRSAAALGAGHFRVATLIDGVTMSASEFDIYTVAVQ